MKLSNKKILVISYKIEKGKGSEDGTGYNFLSRLASRTSDLTIITRINNAELLKTDPAFSSVKIIGIDLPKVLSFYKKGERGIVLYYYLWQIHVGRKVAQLNKLTSFDVIHHFNFHSDWFPHFLANPNGKLVWGPIAHTKKTRLSYIHSSQRLCLYLKEVLKSAIKTLAWETDPFLKSAISRTDVILYGNNDIARPFELALDKVHYQPQAGGNARFKLDARQKSHFNVLSIGRFVPCKNFDLVIEAFKRFCETIDSDVSLTLIGHGELEAHLRNKVKTLNLESHVRFEPWVNQEDLLLHYERASVFLFPSFEAQGMVVSEAMAAALPIIAIQGTGPAFLAGPAGLLVAPGTFESTADDLAKKLTSLYNEYSLPSQAAHFMARAHVSRAEFDARLDWDVIVSRIMDFYE